MPLFRRLVDLDAQLAEVLLAPLHIKSVQAFG